MIAWLLSERHRACRRSISAHFAGRTSPAAETAMRAHVLTCAGCQDHYRRHNLIARHDPRALSAEERIGRALGFQPGAPAADRRWWSAPALPLGALACAAALALFILPGRQALRGPGATVGPDPVARGAAASETSATSAARAPHLLVYRFDAGAGGGEAPRLASGSMHAGDELAFAYSNPAGRPYLAIFGVDESGRVYWFHPAWPQGALAPRAVAAAAGPGPHELPDAIRHDVRGRHLTIVAAFADRPVGAAEIEAAVRAGGPAGGALPGLDDVVTVRQELDVQP